MASNATHPEAGADPVGKLWPSFIPKSMKALQKWYLQSISKKKKLHLFAREGCDTSLMLSLTVCLGFMAHQPL